MKLRNLSRQSRPSFNDSEDSNLSTQLSRPVVLDLTHASHHLKKNTSSHNNRVTEELFEEDSKEGRKKTTRGTSRKTTFRSNHRFTNKKSRSTTSSSDEDEISATYYDEDSISSNSTSSEESRLSFSSLDSEEQEISWNTSESSTTVVRTKRRLEDFEDGEHVTIWNCVERRKIAGNAAPLAKNLKKYFEKHPECEIYSGQDMLEDPETGFSDIKTKNSTVSHATGGGHVSIWNRVEKRKIAGNAAPLWKNLENYLQKHPECEVYNGQDKEFLERKRQKSKQLRLTRDSRKMRRVSSQSATRASEPCVVSVDKEEIKSGTMDNNKEVMMVETPEESKDIVIVRDSKEEEMALFVDSVFSDYTKDLATFLNDDLFYKKPTELEANLSDGLWERVPFMEDIFVLDHSKGMKTSKGDEDAALELSEEELSLLNDDLDVLVDFSANNYFSSSFYVT
ncbi:hypothetical protein Gasu2_44530 [Galdieria sulphuraria]|uniref:BRK domain-containing protein n=1 Tax=Galdieria sulphuraria TaxID=130081 RepID=M2W6S3_GALSU|nr:uncharacterized protein Gasu_11740 [Galdieria sulphuraria]EME31496.1 hypothetical protein Gasu_11740 [Galdieria sulphuraria]GJD10251.1 hypothetical protein Gasu2_44530 [Galdieria sulphuraria]|eukprot:XP_005708016.1 hypothetical protein Gasu_11740 [Galdieria sulphuraria]